jgi:hypothetical protein
MLLGIGSASRPDLPMPFQVSLLIPLVAQFNRDPFVYLTAVYFHVAPKCVGAGWLDSNRRDSEDCTKAEKCGKTGCHQHCINRIVPFAIWSAIAPWSRRKVAKRLAYGDINHDRSLVASLKWTLWFMPSKLGRDVCFVPILLKKGFV